MVGFREIYARSDDGGVQLGASADRWYLTDEYIHLAPHHAEGRLVRWDAQLKPIVDDPDRGAVAVVLRTQGLNTLFLTGVNIDQCVTTTMEDAYFRDYDTVLLEDACATSSPDYCREAVVFDARNCWGFTMTTQAFADPRPFEA